ncbi:Trimethylguanosine synthase [Trichinella sp. T6]|nr:Trimethylguanosine synthase [Trichinella sp. T6]
MDSGMCVDKTLRVYNAKKDKFLRKYWRQRHNLFSLFDRGIALDRESWYSVTPEKIAKHIAKRCKFTSVVDAFCGAGSNAIHFSLAGLKVTAVDIDPEKIKLAKHNAAIYGVQDSIEFLCADFLKIYKNLSADFVFLSPPWGGPEYLNHDVYDVKRMNRLNGKNIFKRALKISPRIVYFLPRNSSILQIIHLAEPGTVIECTSGCTIDPIELQPEAVWLFEQQQTSVVELVDQLIERLTGRSARVNGPFELGVWAALRFNACKKRPANDRRCSEPAFSSAFPDWRSVPTNMADNFQHVGRVLFSGFGSELAFRPGLSQAYQRFHLPDSDWGPNLYRLVELTTEEGQQQSTSGTGKLRCRYGLSGERDVLSKQGRRHRSDRIRRRQSIGQSSRVGTSNRQHMLAETTVGLLVGLVDEQEDQIEPRKQRRTDVHVGSQTETGFVVTLGRVAGRHHRHPGRKLAPGAGFANAQLLLFHRLEQALLVRVELVEFVNATATVVGQHQRARFDRRVTVYAPSHRDCQTRGSCRTGAHVHSTTAQIGTSLQQMVVEREILCSIPFSPPPPLLTQTRIADQKGVNVRPDSRMLLAGCSSTEQCQHQARFDRFMTVYRWTQ